MEHQLGVADLILLAHGPRGDLPIGIARRQQSARGVVLDAEDASGMRATQSLELFQTVAVKAVQMEGFVLAPHGNMVRAGACHARGRVRGRFGAHHLPLLHNEHRLCRHDDEDAISSRNRCHALRPALDGGPVVRVLQGGGIDGADLVIHSTCHDAAIRHDADVTDDGAVPLALDPFGQAIQSPAQHATVGRGRGVDMALGLINGEGRDWLAVAPDHLLGGRRIRFVQVIDVAVE
mmetsp:Transcript_108891/g.184710  ORF Transcript_108891/g.184710 Transcript_108891/m.184710 type:complete len:235 (-) Transcript_108891:801-1505(-)